MQTNEKEIKAAYNAGLDRRKNGANESNCNFGHFRTKEQTKAWEQGAAGEKLKIQIIQIS